ncbi:hypothetical protein [Mesorhizobium sp. M0060]|uniref:hypothetical protein n=1 Tax=Mesorhizobium sp. M0060 TaxID=2956866 RepID=UPI0033389655
MYQSFFRPRSTKDLVRVGSVYDGGYVLPGRIMPATNALLSLGLSDEWDFEDEFSKQSGVPVVCFDHTVTAKFWTRKVFANLSRGIVRADRSKLLRAMRFLRYRRFFGRPGNRHIQKAVGFSASGGVGLCDAIDMAGFSQDIFLKMDIEGWEYRVLDEIVGRRELFTGLAIEFHDIDLHEDRIQRFIRAISDVQMLVHFHPNTHTQIGPGGMALVVELTFMRRDLLEPSEPTEYRSLPLSGLDSPNLPGDIHKVIEFVE